MRATLTLPLAFAALMSCTDFPELDGTVAPDVAHGAFPALVPLDPLLARAEASAADPQLSQVTADGLAGRIAALRARAARLRGPVIPAALRARMLRGL